MFDFRDNGTIYIRSPQPLNPYPANLTDCLIGWAEAAPDRLFLAQRNADRSWRTLSYAQAYEQVRCVAQSLLNRGLNSNAPVLITGGNSIEHALVALACLHIGVPYVPGSASLSPEVLPGLVFADGHAMADLLRASPGAAVDDAHAAVGADTIAKIMFTSGTVDAPKGVITTHRMLCSNQEMIRSALPGLVEEPPVLCDWLPWNHVYGGSHNFGMVLCNGGTLYIDEGKATAAGFEKTLENLRVIAPSAYFNVPRGYEMLVPALRNSWSLRRHFFSRMKTLFCAGAVMDQRIWDDLREMATQTRGEQIRMTMALGATETSPLALMTRHQSAQATEVGLPVPGVELKLLPRGHRYEARLRGPNVTPGYWNDPERTAAAFDEEGFYKLGDALAFADADRPEQGLVFAGRIAKDFKLSSGTWASAEELRRHWKEQSG